MTSSADPKPRRLPYGWTVGVVLVLLGGVLVWPAHRWAGEPGVVALCWAVGIGLISSLVSHIPVARAEAAGGDPWRLMNAHLMALGMRLVLTLGAAAIVVFAVKPPLMPFAIWITAAYMAVLAVEVVGTLRESGQNHPPSGSGEARPSGESKSAMDATSAPQAANGDEAK